MAAVPESNVVYPLLGKPQDSLSSGNGTNVTFPSYLGSQYDASTTNLSYSIPAPVSGSSGSDPVKLVLSFLSPITPTSTLRQSIPAAYLSVYVEGSFDIDVYIDVNGQWVSGDRNSAIEWSFSTSSLADAPAGPAAEEDQRMELKRGDKSIKTFKVWKKDQLLFTEHGDRAEWGQLHFTAPSVSWPVELPRTQSTYANNTVLNPGCQS